MRKLSGRTRYRIWKGKLVLQVEQIGPWAPNTPAWNDWRDATIEDLSVSQDRKMEALEIHGDV